MGRMQREVKWFPERMFRKPKSFPVNTRRDASGSPERQFFNSAKQEMSDGG